MDERQRGDLKMMARLLWVFSILLIALFGAVSWLVLTTPSADEIKGCLRTKLFQVWLCDDSPEYTPLGDISPYMKSLVLISEDASFYGHNGFDWDELRHSFETDLAQGRAVRGGSTITQQLAKNVFLTNEKTIVRKVREALLTVQIETLLTKDKILEKYLNVIELGPKIYGVGAAAKYYFDKAPADLNILEAAYLTFLIPNPKIYGRSFKKNELTKFGRYRILDLCFKLLQTHHISEDQYLSARAAVDLFPWRSLPENLIVGLAGGSVPAENRGPIAAPSEVPDPDVTTLPEAETAPEAETTPEAAAPEDATPKNSPAPKDGAWPEPKSEPTQN